MKCLLKSRAAGWDEPLPYWEYRWVRYGKVIHPVIKRFDHRITKAIKLTKSKV